MKKILILSLAALSGCVNTICGDGDISNGHVEIDAGLPEIQDPDAGPMDADAGPTDPDAGPVDADAGPVDADAGPVDAGVIDALCAAREDLCGEDTANCIAYIAADPCPDDYMTWASCMTDNSLCTDPNGVCLAERSSWWACSQAARAAVCSDYCTPATDAGCLVTGATPANCINLCAGRGAHPKCGVAFQAIINCYNESQAYCDNTECTALEANWRDCMGL